MNNAIYKVLLTKNLIVCCILTLLPNHSSFSNASPNLTQILSGKLAYKQLIHTGRETAAKVRGEIVQGAQLHGRKVVPLVQRGLRRQQLPAEARELQRGQ